MTIYRSCCGQFAFRGSAILSIHTGPLCLIHIRRSYGSNIQDRSVWNTYESQDGVRIPTCRTYIYFRSKQIDQLLRIWSTDRFFRHECTPSVSTSIAVDSNSQKMAAPRVTFAGRTLPSYARTVGRAVHVKIHPRPRNLSESREVLRVLQQYGEVVMYKHLRVR